MTTLEPPPANGVHTWIIQSAWHCRCKLKLDATATAATIANQAGNLRPGRRFQPREIEDAVEKVFGTRLEDRPVHAKPPKLAWSRKATDALPAFTLDELKAASPVQRLDGIPADQFVHVLFPDNDRLICVGKSATTFATRTRREFGRDRLAGAAFIVPCYMTARSGLTQTGKPSEHCLANCGDRRWIVCDFDEPNPADHPKIIGHLARYKRLVMVLSSGGKSLHAWFLPSGEDEKFWRLAVQYGADPALWRNRSSFVRMPNGTRDNGNRQTVVFFDYAVARSAWMNEGRSE